MLIGHASTTVKCGGTEIILITIYSKSEQADVSPDEIRQILGGIG
jgi:hypothetical protein